MSADGPLAQQVIDIVLRATTRLQRQLDPDALHAAALADLLWANAGDGSVDRSISHFRMAASLADRPAKVLADLSAAYLVRADRTQAARDFLDALEAAERALAIEPANMSARFNLALAIERLGLDDEAAEAWRAYLAVDSRSGWAKEAAERLRQLTSIDHAVAPLGPNATEPDLIGYAVSLPQQARLIGWDSLLGAWGAAVIRGDANIAADRLWRASVLGDALRRSGGDATLADAAGYIRSRGSDTQATLMLARAHQAYSEGRLAFRTQQPHAGRLFDTALQASSGSLPLQLWARLFAGAALVRDGRARAAEQTIREVVAATDTARHPALAAHSRWALSTTLLRSGRYEEGRQLARAAGIFFERAGEGEHLGAVQLLVADAEYALGDIDATHTSMYRALMTLRRHRASLWLHTALYIWAGAASAAFPRASVHLQNEGVRAAARTGSPLYLVEARLGRARLLMAAGDTILARNDIKAAEALIDRVPPGTMRDWMRADRELAEANALLGSDARRAALALNGVVAFFERIQNPARLFPALVARAEARFGSGQPRAAEADLDRAVALLDEQRSAIASFPMQASLLEAARRVVDQIVMLRVNANRPAEALAYLERGRASLASLRGARLEASARRTESPTGQVIADYALIGDTLLIWTLVDKSTHLVRMTVDRGWLTRTVDRVLSSLELRTSDAATGRDLVFLYDRLIRPIEPRLIGERIVIVADGEIAGVPFGALRDSVHHRYLVESHVLRFASSLRDAVTRPSPVARRLTSALLVADPAFDSRANPGVARLPGARAEVDALAAEYSDATLLAGLAADGAAVKKALPTARIIHYAGHAVLDDARPDQSYLLLAPGPGASEDNGRLSAAEIEQLNLRQVGLVVLSACRTSGASAKRTGGFTGLAGAFLAAGAGGVVGSLWRVDDDLTRSLMVEFHRAYRASGDGAAALRTAQLRMMSAHDQSVRSVAAWAGFRYAGA